MSVKSIRVLFVCGLLVAYTDRMQTVAIAQSPNGSKAQSATVPAPTEDPLLRLLVSKGVLTTEEAALVLGSGTPAQQRDRLETLLKDKGLISKAEFDALQSSGSDETVVNVNATPSKSKASAGLALAAGAPKPVAGPPVIAAVAPVRLLPIEPQAREGLIPDLKLGSGARIKPYGYFKTSVIHDSSSPLGNDFPLPLLAADTGPGGSPEFHLKARALRLGVNFEWLDPAPKTAITGRLEFDFEGDFTRVNNRNISSIRSSQPSLRLAWARIDRRFNDKFTGFALFGQDWSPFASSTVPNTIETTAFHLGYGNTWERVPQFRFGLNYNAGGKRSLRFQPELALVIPTAGNTPANVADQLGFGERQGPDSERPNIQ